MHGMLSSGIATREPVVSFLSFSESCADVLRKHAIFEGFAQPRPIVVRKPVENCVPGRDKGQIFGDAEEDQAGQTAL